MSFLEKVKGLVAEAERGDEQAANKLVEDWKGKVLLYAKQGHKSISIELGIGSSPRILATYRLAIKKISEEGLNCKLKEPWDNNIGIVRPKVVIKWD